MLHIKQQEKEILQTPFLQSHLKKRQAITEVHILAKL